MPTGAQAGGASGVLGFVGVYRADGGVVGEVRYVIGHLLGTAHCSLCDLTHTWRRKPEWDAMVRRLGVAFDLRHLNELDSELAIAVASTDSPVVFARTRAGLKPVLTPDELEELGGSVAAFEEALRSRMGVTSIPE